MSNFKRNVITLGVTGGIACGKSEVGHVLERLGFSVCDADHVAHNLMKKGTPVFDLVLDRFGPQILLNDGEISRPVLGGIIFKNPERRKVLNQIVHPAVRSALERWLEKKKQAQENIAVLIPLLFECQMQDLGFDAIWCVSALDSAVLARLKGRGLDRDEARLRIDSQMPLSEKERCADDVIQNFGTLDELMLAVQEGVQSMMD